MNHRTLVRKIFDNTAKEGTTSNQIQKVRLQRLLRNPATGQYETKSVATAIRKIVDHEWSGWEKIVLDSLPAAIAQIGVELEPGSCQLDDSMTALYHLNDILSISAGKAVRTARRRSMVRHEVSMHASFKPRYT